MGRWRASALRARAAFGWPWRDAGDAGPTAQGQDRTGQGGVFLRRQVLLPEEDGPGSGPGDVPPGGEKGEGHRARLVTQISLDIEVVVEGRAGAPRTPYPGTSGQSCGCRRSRTARPLGPVPLLPGIFALVVPDAGGDARGYLGGGDPNDAVAEALALPGGDGDPGEGEEDAVGAQHLAQLALPHVQRGDLVVVDDGAQAGQDRDISAWGYLRWR